MTQGFRKRCYLKFSNQRPFQDMPNTTEVLYIFRHNFYKLAVKVVGRGKNVMLKQPSPQKKKSISVLFPFLDTV